MQWAFFFLEFFKVDLDLLYIFIFFILGEWLLSPSGTGNLPKLNVIPL